MPPTHTLSTGDAATLLGVTAERVRQLDDLLQPLRLRNGQRRYDPTIIERIARERGR